MARIGLSFSKRIELLKTLRESLPKDRVLEAYKNILPKFEKRVDKQDFTSVLKLALREQKKYRKPCGGCFSLKDIEDLSGGSYGAPESISILVSRIRIACMKLTYPLLANLPSEAKRGDEEEPEYEDSEFIRAAELQSRKVLQLVGKHFRCLSKPIPISIESTEDAQTYSEYVSELLRAFDLAYSEMKEDIIMNKINEGHDLKPVVTSDYR